jgi:hypothetical protein
VSTPGFGLVPCLSVSGVGAGAASCECCFYLVDPYFCFLHVFDKEFSEHYFNWDDIVLSINFESVLPASEFSGSGLVCFFLYIHLMRVCVLVSFRNKSLPVTKESNVSNLWQVSYRTYTTVRHTLTIRICLPMLFETFSFVHPFHIFFPVLFLIFFYRVLFFNYCRLLTKLRKLSAYDFHRRPPCWKERWMEKV